MQRAPLQADEPAPVGRLEQRKQEEEEEEERLLDVVERLTSVSLELSGLRGAAAGSVRVHRLQEIYIYILYVYIFIIYNIINIIFIIIYLYI